MKTTHFSLMCLICFSLFSCVQDRRMEDGQLIIRLSHDPERLNPLLSSSRLASQIENMIFQPLAEVDPLELDFRPILLDKLPDVEVVDMEGLGLVDRVDLKINKDAKWDDQHGVTYEDILFTLKIIFNDYTQMSRYKSSLGFIKKEEHDKNDMQFVSFYLDTAHYNAVITLCNFHIMPRHVYDSMGWMDHISLNNLILNTLSEADKNNLEKFAQQFNLEKFSRNRVVGSGAYELVNWNTGYEIKLRKKQNWWGDKYEDQNLFKAIPKELVYRIIPDDQLAVTALNSNNVDLIAGLNPEKFDVMRKTYADQYDFMTPTIPQYYYIILNNQSAFLKDRAVRQGLAHIVDQAKLIEVVLNGHGTITTAPFLPISPNYNKKVKPYLFDVEKAKSLFESSGWRDSDEDGIRDKIIDDQLIQLSMRLNITGGVLGQNIALLLRNNAQKAGAEINIVTQKFSLSREDMKVGNFEMIATRGNSPFLESNLKAEWHSSSFAKNGNNLAGYQSDEMDAILEELEVTEIPSRRLALNQKFHERIHEDQPVLFLMSPAERIVVRNDWHLDPSARRPGYFENLAYLKE